MASNKDDILLRLAALSCELGNDIELTQGPGGNISYKEGNLMWIKASGTWMADAKNKNIFSLLDLKTLSFDLERHTVSDLQTYQIQPNSLRPSIETTMHALISKHFVIHIHALDILAYAVLQNGKEALTKKLHSLDWLWIPYAKPGIELTYLIAKESQKKARDIYILENHGVIIAADTIHEAKILLSKLLKPCRREKREQNQINHKIPLNIPGMTLCEDPDINSLAYDEISLDLLQRGCLYPDQAVFLGVENPVISQYDPSLKKKFVVIPFQGCYLLDTEKKSTLAQLKGHALLLQRLSKEDKLNILNKHEITQLLNWDAEQYRQSVQQ